MTAVLVCSDSFGLTDPAHPFHWCDQLQQASPGIEIWNSSQGGASNALITLQLMQGLTMNPDFVVLCFTNEHRLETDGNLFAKPQTSEPEDMISYLKSRYRPNVYAPPYHSLSDNLEKIKSYFYILLCLTTLTQKQIPFCFSLGGFEYQQDVETLLAANYLKNQLTEFKANELRLNLWNHMADDPASLIFHVDNAKIHTVFANECLTHLNRNHA